MKGKKISQKNRKYHRNHKKTQKGGWFEIFKNHAPPDDPLVYRLFNENRELPINDGKRVADFSEEKLEELRGYPKTWHEVGEDNTEKNSLDEVTDTYGETDMNSQTLDKCADLPEGCNLSNIDGLQESTCEGWLDSGKILKLSAMLTALNYSEKKDGSELVMVNTNMEKQWGNKDCSDLKKKIEENYKLIYEFKNCAAFKKIVDFKIYQHNFKKEHLSIIPMTFNIFPNIQSITFGVDKESFTLTPEEKQCLEKKEKIKFDIQDGKYGKEIVVERANVLGGKKHQTLKVLQKHKRRLFKNRRTRNNKIV
jgi:hypothetical protein